MPSLPSNPQTSDQPVSTSRFASLGQSAFYRGQATAGNNDIALVSVRDNSALTNNVVESFHAALRRRVQVAHRITVTRS